ncbi:MAG: hypothetical protein ACO3AV_03730 [Ilumatobacteraceae bacterium]
MSKKRIPTKMKAIGLGIGLVAGVGAGLALEASGSSSAAAPSIEIAADAGTDSEMPADDVDRAAEREARLRDVLQPLVDDGTLTQEQADKVVAVLAAAGPMGGDGHRGGRHGGGMMANGLQTVADTIGITTDELSSALAGGQTIAQVAEANGSSAQAVIDALVAEVETHFAEEVASGEHTQADADARIAEATTRITDMVNNGGMPGGRGDGHHGDMHGDDMHGDDTDGDMSGTDSTGGSIDGGPADTATTVAEA